jgi:dolichyl-phosphate beta-glucosyltransferase
MDISIVIPTYNSAGSIADVVSQVVRFFRTKSSIFELIVVDDGSSDETDARLKDIQAEYQELRVLRNVPNRGKGYSVRRGFQESRGEYVVFTDSDLPFGLESLLRAVEVLRQGTDVVIGSRVLPESRFVMNPRHFPYIFVRHLLGRTLLTIVNLAFGLRVSDTQCGLKGCRKHVAKHVADRLTIDRFVFDVELLYVARLGRFSISEIPVVLDYTGAVTTVRIMRNILSVLRDLMTIRARGLQGKYK